MRPKLSASRKAARRRISYITPENCGKVLARPVYWTREFLDLYLDLCDEAGLHRPADGYLLAQQAPMLASRVRVGEVEGEFRNEADKLSARVTALAVFASCCRSCGRLQEAELNIKWAQDLAVDARLTPKAGCELVRRHAALKWVQKSEEAEAWIRHAVALADRLGDQPNLADALVLYGLYLADADRGGVEHISRSLAVADLKTPRGRRTFDGAVFNLAFTIRRSGNLAEATHWLSRTKKRLARRPSTLDKLRVLWMEALFSAELGSTRYGIRLLEKTRAKLFELPSLGDYIVCSVDLADVHQLEGDSKAADAVIRDTRRSLESRSSETAALSAPAHELEALLSAYLQTDEADQKDRMRRDLVRSLQPVGFEILGRATAR